MFPMIGAHGLSLLTHSVLSHSIDNMRLWAVLLLPLLTETFAADGEYNI